MHGWDGVIDNAALHDLPACQMTAASAATCMALLTHWLACLEVMIQLHSPHPTSTLLWPSDMAALIWACSMPQKWQPWLGYIPLHTSALHGWWKAVNARHGCHDQATCFTTLWHQRVGYWAMPDLAVMIRQHVSPHSGAKGWDTEQCQIWQSWPGNMFHHTLAPKGGKLSNARFGSHDQATCLSTPSAAWRLVGCACQPWVYSCNVLNVAKLHCHKSGCSPKNVTWFTRP